MRFHHCAFALARSLFAVLVLLDPIFGPTESNGAQRLMEILHVPSPLGPGEASAESGAECVGSCLGPRIVCDCEGLGRLSGGDLSGQRHHQISPSPQKCATIDTAVVGTDLPYTFQLIYVGAALHER